MAQTVPSDRFRRYSTVYLLLLGLTLLTIALVVRSGIFARKNPGQPINSAMREALEDEGLPQFSTADAAVIAQKYPTAFKLPSGLRYVVRDPGTGTATPAAGDRVTANYDGRLLDGTPFDSSYKRGQPLTFRVGVGDVIKGWDEAFLRMKKGEKRTLIVPYWLGYGISGRPPTIPPRATLVVEVELIDFH